MAISIFFQTIIILYCGKAWCVTCVLWGRINCHDMILFCFPPQVMLKFYLNFLFNITAINQIKKYPLTHDSVIFWYHYFVSSWRNFLVRLDFFTKKWLHNFFDCFINSYVLNKNIIKYNFLTYKFPQYFLHNSFTFYYSRYTFFGL